MRLALVSMPAAFASEHHQDEHSFKDISQKMFLFSEPQQFTPIKFHNEYQKELTTQSLQGKWLFINFWASYCHPCIVELPQLEHLSNSLDNQNVQIVTMAINMSQKEIGKTFQKLYIEKLPRFSVSEEIWLSEVFLIDSLPMTLLVSPDGLLVGRAFGAASWRKNDVLQLLKSVEKRERTSPE